MTREVTKPQKWDKPQLKHLGKINDVAASPPIGPQGGGGKS